MGVTAITVTPRGGYIGPPMVTIAGGGGTGATAVAQFNSADGTVSGIVVTSPGFGYTSNPTVTLSGGGTNVQTAVTGVTRGLNVSGGLTKLGTGTLALSATNTYGGATTVSNGTLRLGLAQAVPTNSALILAGGSFDLGGFSYTNGTVFVTRGGSINGGTLACGSLTQSGGGTLALGGTLSSSAPIRIDDGILQMRPIQAGLYEAPVAGSFNQTDAMSTSIVARLTTRMANMVYYEPYDTTWIYSGFIWNRAATNVTWTFAEQFDDSVLLKIDSTTVINGGNGWNVPTIGTLTLTPGPHAFEARFGQGGGGAGPNVAYWWTTTSFGFGFDNQGRNETNIANYVALADPGDGSLLSLTAVTGGLTNRINPAASVELGAAGVLDLGTNTQVQTLANLSGSGIVSNGVLAVTGTITPGGTNVIGTLTVANSAGLSGTLRVDVATNGDSDRLVIAGNMDLSSLSLEIANPAQLNTAKSYTVASVSGTSTGAFASVAVPDNRWHVVYRPDGTVLLIYANGTLISVR
jgi:autotransporter-associated beta strand protein